MTLPRPAPVGVPEELRDEAAAALARYVEAGGNATQTEQLLGAFAKSPFLAVQAAGDAQAFAAMLADPGLAHARRAGDYHAGVAGLLAGVDDMPEAKARLRRSARSWPSCRRRPMR